MFDSIILQKKHILLFFWGMVMFIVTRQVPFSNIAFLGNIGVIMVCVLGLEKSRSLIRKNYIFFLSWGLLMVLYAVYRGNDLSNIFRFSVIVILLLFAYFIKMPFKALKILFFFTFLQCIFLICLEVILMAFFDLGSYGVIRHFFLQNGWGDVYSYDGIFYRIPIKGNSLIPFCYIFSYYFPLFPKKRLWVCRCMYLAASVFAGNFAYLISIFVFHVIYYFTQNKSTVQFKNKVLLSGLLGALILPPVLIYTMNIISMKQDVSLSTRTDQTEVLMDNMAETGATFVFGQGLGNLVKVVTSYRDYSNMNYYELQVLYFLNQMGVLNFVIYIIIHLYLAIKKIRYLSLLFVYLCYVIYAVTNPYILDTVQFIVIVSLVTASNFLYENRKHNNIILSKP